MRVWSDGPSWGRFGERQFSWPIDPTFATFSSALLLSNRRGWVPPVLPWLRVVCRPYHFYTGLDMILKSVAPRPDLPDLVLAWVISWSRLGAWQHLAFDRTQIALLDPNAPFRLCFLNVPEHERNGLAKSGLIPFQPFIY